MTTTLDFFSYADALEALRLKLRKDGPDSGLHRGEAVDADRLLATTRDLMREIGERRKARLEQAQQGDTV